MTYLFRKNRKLLVILLLLAQLVAIGIGPARCECPKCGVTFWQCCKDGDKDCLHPDADARAKPASKTQSLAQGHCPCAWVSNAHSLATTQHRVAAAVHVISVPIFPAAWADATVPCIDRSHPHSHRWGPPLMCGAFNTSSLRAPPIISLITVFVGLSA